VQTDDEFVADLLGETASSSTTSDTKRTLPKDEFWKRKIKTPEAKPDSQEPEMVVPQYPDNEFDLSFERAAAIAYVPPAPRSKAKAPPQQQWTAAQETFQPAPVEAVPPPQPAVQQHAPVHTNAPIAVPLCPGCHASLEVGSRFCGECGYQLQVKIPGCHLCGAPLEPSAKFCGECGSQRVADSGPTAEAEKPTQRGWVNKLSKFMDE
jgi:hypothetical protein